MKRYNFWHEWGIDCARMSEHPQGDWCRYEDVPGWVINEEKCKWKDSGLSYWDTGCGQAFQFSNDYGPIDNGFNYCHHCGKPLEEKKPLPNPPEKDDE